MKQHRSGANASRVEYGNDARGFKWKNSFVSPLVQEGACDAGAGEKHLMRNVLH